MPPLSLPRPAGPVIPPYWLGEAHQAIARAATTHPALRWSGFTDDQEGPKPECVATALAFLQCGPVRAVRTVKACRSSYALKHDAERWGRLIGFSPYVGNGDLIAAALYLGLLVKRMPGTPNAFVGAVLIESTCVGAGTLRALEARLPI